MRGILPGWYKEHRPDLKTSAEIRLFSEGPQLPLQGEIESPARSAKVDWRKKSNPSPRKSTHRGVRGGWKQQRQKMGKLQARNCSPQSNAIITTSSRSSAAPGAFSLRYRETLLCPKTNIGKRHIKTAAWRKYLSKIGNHAIPASNWLQVRAIQPRTSPLKGAKR